MSGIYKIICVPTGKFYIGSAVNLRQRWIDHRKCLRKGCHYNSYLQKAFKKYGEENFSFEIIEFCDKKQLVKREQFYLDTFLFAQEYINGIDKRFKKLGFNICPVAGNTLGTKRTEEQKQKMAAWQTGKNGYWFNKEFSKEHLTNLSLALSGSRNGMFGKTHSIIEKQNRAKKYKGVGNPNFGNNWTDEMKENISKMNSKLTVSLDITSGKFYYYASQTEAAEEFSCNRIDIYNSMKRSQPFKNHLFFN